MWGSRTNTARTHALGLQIGLLFLLSGFFWLPSSHSTSSVRPRISASSILRLHHTTKMSMSDTRSSLSSSQLSPTVSFNFATSGFGFRGGVAALRGGQDPVEEAPEESGKAAAAKAALTAGEEALLAGMKRLSLKDQEQTMKKIVREQPSVATKLRETGELDNIKWKRFEKDLEQAEQRSQAKLNSEDGSDFGGEGTQFWRENEDEMKVFNFTDGPTPAERLRTWAVGNGSDTDNRPAGGLGLKAMLQEEGRYQKPSERDDEHRFPSSIPRPIWSDDPKIREGPFAPKDLPRGWTAREIAPGRVQYSNEELGRVQFVKPVREDGTWAPPPGFITDIRMRESDPGAKSPAKSTGEAPKTAGSDAKPFKGGSEIEVNPFSSASVSKSQTSMKFPSVSPAGAKNTTTEQLPLKLNATTFETTGVEPGWVKEIREQRGSVILGEDGHFRVNGTLLSDIRNKYADKEEEGGASKQAEGKPRKEEERTHAARGGQAKERPGGAVQEEEEEGEGGEGEGGDVNMTKLLEDAEGSAARRNGMHDMDYKMWVACEDGQNTEVEDFLRRGANPNYQHQGVFAWSPMHLAAINDHPDTLSLLQEFGGRLDLRDHSGRTPLRLAKKHLRMLAVRGLEQMMGHERNGGSDTELEIDTTVRRDFQPRAKHSGGEGQNGTGQNETDRYAEVVAAERRELNRYNRTDLEDFVRYQEARISQANASTARRRALFGQVAEEPEDAAGMTESQKHHIERLTKAASLNRETGVPMEHLLGMSTDHLDRDEEDAKHKARQRVAEYGEGPLAPPPESGEDSSKGGYTSRGYTSHSDVEARQRE